MQGEPSSDEILQVMLVDLMHEAELVRHHDPVRASHLDDAVNDLRTVIAERSVIDRDPDARH